MSLQLPRNCWIISIHGRDTVIHLKELNLYFFADGITEYLATEGSRGHLGIDRYHHIDFRDLTNDANKALGPRGAPGGLGKLVDNAAHLGNVSQDVYDSPVNHHFVGWERSRSSPVRLDFKFDRRKFELPPLVIV